MRNKNIVKAMKIFRRLVKARLINELTTPLHFANQEYYISQGIKRPCWLVLLCALRLCVPYGSVCVKRGTYGKAENG